MSKWIEFKEAESTGKTKIFNVIAKEYGSILGKIKWFSSWRKYCFFPEKETIFETDCLTDITNFIKELMNERKKIKENEMKNIKNFNQLFENETVTVRNLPLSILAKAVVLHDIDNRAIEMEDNDEKMDDVEPMIIAKTHLPKYMKSSPANLMKKIGLEADDNILDDEVLLMLYKDESLSSSMDVDLSQVEKYFKTIK